MVEVKDMTMIILNKVSRMEDSVESIRTNTSKTREMVGKMEFPFSQFPTVIQNSQPEFPTITQNGVGEGNKQSNGTSPGKLMKEENKK